MVFLCRKKHAIYTTLHLSPVELYITYTRLNCVYSNMMCLELFLFIKRKRDAK